MTFENWKRIVDRRLEKVIGLSSDFLTDWHWRDAYDEGMTPNEAVAQFIVDEEIDERLMDEA